MLPNPLHLFGQLLRGRRNAAGWSRRQLAERAKLSDCTIKFLEQGYLSRIRIGAGSPSEELVSHLAMLAHDPKNRLAERERYWAVASDW